MKIYRTVSTIVECLLALTTVVTIILFLYEIMTREAVILFGAITVGAITLDILIETLYTVWKDRRKDGN